MDLWEKLGAYRHRVAGRPILDLFGEGRAAAFSVRHDGLLFDYSKTGIDDETRALLLALAEASGVAARRDAMFEGRRINETEHRAVLHTALRNLDGRVAVDGRDVMPAVRETLARMERFADDLRAGRVTGHGGPITDVVNIGIGGSDLGPAMATLALSPFHDGPRCHFVSNVDGAHVSDTLRPLDPATTLVIIASKTFTTIETMTNAGRRGAGCRARFPSRRRRFAAVSTALEQAPPPSAFAEEPGLRL
jgi:glucose-6-phosphate isomerase